MASPESPFKISIPEDKLKLLQQKVSLVTFPDELEDSGTKYGAPPGGLLWRLQDSEFGATEGSQEEQSTMADRAEGTKGLPSLSPTPMGRLTVYL